MAVDLSTEAAVVPPPERTKGCVTLEAYSALLVRHPPVLIGRPWPLMIIQGGLWRLSGARHMALIWHIPDNASSSGTLISSEKCVAEPPEERSLCELSIIIIIIIHVSGLEGIVVRLPRAQTLILRCYLQPRPRRILAGASWTTASHGHRSDASMTARLR